MAFIYTAHKAHHLRIYSSVDVASGIPLPDGKKKQQSIKLVDQDDRDFKSKNSNEVKKIGSRKEDEIREWEKEAHHVRTGTSKKRDTSMTVAAFFNDVFLPQMRKEKTPSTMISYQGFWRGYLAKHFGETKLKDYKRDHATDFLEEKAATLAHNTVMHIRAVASAIFQYAIDKEYLKAPVGESRNPWRDARRVKGKRMPPTKKYTQAEVERILLALDNFSSREKYGAELAQMVVAVAFYGGLRPSEIAGLKWENIKFDENKIYVSEVFVAGEHKDRTKTEVARKVKMFPQLRERLLFWHSRWLYPTSGFVFPSQRSDRPIRLNDLGNRTIPKLLKGSGIEWAGLYACRRGFGTLLVDSGAPLEETCRAMGNSAAVVDKFYYAKENSPLGDRAIDRATLAMESAKVN